MTVKCEGQIVEIGVTKKQQHALALMLKKQAPPRESVPFEPDDLKIESVKRR